MIPVNLISSQRSRSLVLGLGLTLCCSAPSFAQTDDPDADASGEPSVIVQQATGPIEEVIVTGRRSYQSLINEAARETENFYMRLNAVLDDEDLRIRCQTESPPETNIRERICRTRYQEELLSRQALSIVQGVGNDDEGNLTFFGSIYDTYPDLARMHREFEEKMLVAVNRDLELNESVRRLLQLKAAVQNFETPAEQRRRDRRTLEDELEAEILEN